MEVVAMASILLLLLAKQCRSVVIMAKSELDTCINTGDPGALNCKKKIVVTLSVSPEVGKAGDALIATVKDPTSKEGKRDLESQISISVYKSKCVVSYALEYVQDVAADPYEKNVAKKKDCQCRLNDKATCGVLKMQNGDFVPGSAGFCCQCEGRRKYKYFRGLPMPKGCGNGGDQGYAFCLRFGQIRYYVWRIRQSILTFEIFVDVLDKATQALETVAVNPNAKQGINTKRTVMATLIGDLASYTQHPNLDGRFFNLPTNSQPEGNWAQFTQVSDPRLLYI